MEDKIKKVAIVQARMGSTRLPGKVLLQIDGVPLLKIMLERVAKASMIDETIIATSSLGRDNEISEFCYQNGVSCFRGNEEDVLSRYYQCASKVNADTIVRLTSDCPLADPEIIDDAIALFLQTGADYVGNTIPPLTSHYPDGSDVEVFTMEALERTYREVTDPYDREHVTFHMWKYDNDFKTAQLTRKNDLSKYRFTVDYPQDLEVVRFVIKELKKQKKFGHLEDIVNIIKSRPEIFMKNEHYDFSSGWARK